MFGVERVRGDIRALRFLFEISRNMDGAVLEIAGMYGVDLSLGFVLVGVVLQLGKFGPEKIWFGVLRWLRGGS